jgi:hypothetical protein
VVDAQRRLYELGLFRTVELLPMPGQERRDVRAWSSIASEAPSARTWWAGWNETDRWRAGWSH